MEIRIAALVGLCLVSSTVWAAEKKLDRTFTVQSGGTLIVEASGADITVTGDGGNQVVVQILATGPQRSLDQLQLTAEQTSQGVTVMQKREQGFWSFLSGWNVKSTIRVRTPRNYRADLSTSGGDLIISQLQGDARGKTSGGDIRVGQIDGAVRMRTSGGDVTIDDVRGDVQLRTSGGDIVAKAIAGAAFANTSGGDIRLSAVRGAVEAGTSGGDVIVDDIRGDVDLKSSGGDIDARAIDGEIQARTSGGGIHAELMGENRGITAKSSGGGIVLHLPPDVAAHVDASSSGGSITTDLPVTTREVRSGKLIGDINGGGPTIHARTSGGSVRLRLRE